MSLCCVVRSLSIECYALFGRLTDDKLGSDINNRGMPKPTLRCGMFLKASSGEFRLIPLPIRDDVQIQLLFVKTWFLFKIIHYVDLMVYSLNK